MKKLISLIFLSVTLIFVGCGGVDSESNKGNANLTKVSKETTIAYDKLGRVTNENDVTYTYDKNGNIASIEGGSQ